MNHASNDHNKWKSQKAQGNNFTKDNDSTNNTSSSALSDKNLTLNETIKAALMTKCKLY